MSPKPDVLLLAPLPDFLLGPLRDSFSCQDWFGAADREALLREAGPGIRGAVGSGETVVDPGLLDRLPRLEIISVLGVGYDGVPLGYCKTRGIRVTHTPEVLTEDVADIALALVLMTSRRLVEANRFLLSGSWARGPFALSSKPGGKRAGILGLGRIGKAIARRLESIGMELGYHGRAPRPGCPLRYFGSLTEMARWCDFLIVACPGGAATRHLVNAEVLCALGPDGTLVNIARGSIVDEAALVHALKHRVIKAAGLDVFADEPRVPGGLPAVESAVLLPHVGSGTHETRRDMAELVLGSLHAHFSGRPLSTLVPELH